MKQFLLHIYENMTVITEKFKHIQNILIKVINIQKFNQLQLRECIDENKYKPTKR